MARVTTRAPDEPKRFTSSDYNATQQLPCV